MKWDGDLFIARPFNSIPTNFQGQQFIPVQAGNSSNCSSSCSDVLSDLLKMKILLN